MFGTLLSYFNRISRFENQQTTAALIFKRTKQNVMIHRMVREMSKLKSQQIKTRATAN